MQTDTPTIGSADLQPGEVIGEYEVQKKIGEGGFGAVYSALHPVIGKSAAIKVLNLEFSKNQQIVSRFVEEARAVNQINHRNIIDIFSFGQLPDGRQYYVMELLEGQPLDTYLEEHGALTPERVVEILGGVAKALDAAHQRGVVHRDLKPENIFLARDTDGDIYPKLLDFGIAKLMTGAEGHKTRTGTQIGTPYYMSPEQCRGVALDHRSDIYSFGVMLHQLLTGQLPFVAETMMGVMMRHVQDPAPPVSSVRPGLPKALDDCLLRMMAKSPDDRPQSVGAAFDEFARLVQLNPSSKTVVDLGAAKTVPGTGPMAMAQPAATAVGTAPGASVTKPSAEASKSSALWWVLGAAVLLGGGTFALLSGGADESKADATAAAAAESGASEPQQLAEPDVAVEPAPVAPERVVEGAPPSAASAEPAPKEIELSVQTTPPQAAVFLDDVQLGLAPGPFKLGRGSEPVSLVVRAKGYQEGVVKYTPKQSGAVTIELSKLRPTPRPSPPVRPQPRPQPRPAPRPTPASGELEF